MNQIYGTAYYIAPEILKSDYNEKCDVWSIGVILFILLGGRPPFGGDNDKEILDAVKQGVFSFAGPEWKSISSDAKDLIKLMLTYDPTLRIGAEGAMNHIWIKKKAHESIDLPSTLNALTHLRTFRVSISVNRIIVLNMAHCFYRPNKKCSKLLSPSLLVS